MAFDEFQFEPQVAPSCVSFTVTLCRTGAMHQFWIWSSKTSQVAIYKQFREQQRMLKTQRPGWFDFGINCLRHILLKLLQHFVGAIRRIAYQVDRTWDPFSVVVYCFRISDHREDGFLISWSCWSRARYDFLRCQCRKRESCEVTLVARGRVATTQNS